MNRTLISLFILSPLIAYILIILISRLHIGSIGTYDRVFLKERLYQVVGLGLLLYFAVTIVMFIPFYYERGPHLMRVFGIVMVALLFVTMIMSYYDSKRFERHKYELVGACLGGWNSLREYVSENPITTVVDVLWKFNFLILSFVSVFLSFDVRNIYCPDPTSNSTNNTVLCGVGFYDDVSPAMYGELKLFFYMCLIAIITLLHLYYGFYRRLVLSNTHIDKEAAKLGRRNRKQRQLIKMKNNELKVMASSWKLDPKDLVIQQELGKGTYGTVYKAVMNKSWIVAVKRFHGDNGGSKKLDENSKEVKFLMRT